MIKINIPKNYRFPTILLILVFLILVFYSFNPPSSTSNDFPTKEKIVSDDKYFLNKNNGSKTEYYVGENQSSNYTVYVEENEQIQYFINKDPNDFEFQAFIDYLQKYGEFDLELYGPWFDKVGYKSYVFFESRMIVVAHPISGSIAEVWHIEKGLNNESFFALFSNDFSINQPQSQNIH
jgi:hypothetical protein